MLSLRLGTRRTTQWEILLLFFLLGHSHLSFLLCSGLRHTLGKAALFSFFVAVSLQDRREGIWASESQRPEDRTSSSTYLTVFQLFIAAKQITSWNCNLGRVWQGQLVSASFRISWHGSKTGGWSLLKQGISTLVLLTLWVGYSLLKGTGICSMFSSILGLYPLDACSTLSLVLTTKYVKCLLPGDGGEAILPTDENQGEACLFTSVVVDVGYCLRL